MRRNKPAKTKKGTRPSHVQLKRRRPGRAGSAPWAVVAVTDVVPSAWNDAWLLDGHTDGGRPTLDDHVGRLGDLVEGRKDNALGVRELGLGSGVDRPLGHHVLVADRDAVALEPCVLTLVGV